MAFRILFSVFGFCLSVQSPGAVEHSELIRSAASRSGLDPYLVLALIQSESQGDPSAVSNKGAKGWVQVVPSFAKECRISNPFHRMNSLMGACECLRKLIIRYGGKIDLALAAYNAGPKHVDKERKIPDFEETKNFVKRVMSRSEKLRAARALE